MSLSEDPLAPPPGYGQAAGRSRVTGGPPEPEADFSRCCTGCGQKSVVILTLGCTEGEHIGEFGYCLRHASGPFWCGRCQQGEPPRFSVPMKVVRKRDLVTDYIQPILDNIFDGEAP